MATSGTKKCTKCGEEKTLTSFGNRSDTVKYPTGKANECLVCANAMRSKWVENNKSRDKEIKKNSYYKKLYGISLEDYNKLFAKQKGCCGCCGKHQTEFERSLAVDHCHHTGEVRGLLCYACNLALGYVYDDTKTLKNMIKYLEKGDAD